MSFLYLMVTDLIILDSYINQMNQFEHHTIHNANTYLWFPNESKLIVVFCKKKQKTMEPQTWRSAHSTS